MIFEEWLTFIFDHPVTKPEWHWNINVAWPELDARSEIAYLTQTFEQADLVLGSFSDRQVNQGFYVLFNADYMFCLRDQTVLLPERLRCIYAMEALFAKCFAVRCSPHLSHLDERGANPLNSVCYMWWDILPIHGLSSHVPERPDSAAIDQACLTVMKQTLEVDNVACQESALHGLGHWSIYYPEVKTVIDVFLKRNNSARSELRSYAKAARQNRIA